MRLRIPTLTLAGAVALASALGVVGCAPQGSDREQTTTEVSQAHPSFATDPDVPVVDDLVYREVEGVQLQLDACLPPEGGDVEAQEQQVRDAAADADADASADDDAGAGADTGAPADTTADPATADPAAATAVDPADLRPAIVVVHGGSWTRGDKGDVAWRSTCQWLAKAGYPSFSVNYRLAPEHPFPAAIDDLRAAVEWLRQPEQVERFRIDPTRIGAFGGSAGGNLVSLLGTSGSGGLDQGSRVAAVVELSGPIDLTGVAVTDDLAPLQLSYLGCRTQDSCAAAFPASAIYGVDESDPPFFVAHSSDERIPIAQSERFVAALRGAGVDTTFIEVEGVLHSIAMLDDRLRDRILDFYKQELVGAAPGVVP